MKRPSAHYKTILVLEKYGFSPQFSGITRYGHDHNWKIITINCLAKDGKLLHADTRNPLVLADLKATWNPDGIIVDNVVAKTVYKVWGKSGIPMVFPDHRADDIGPGAVCVTGNSQSIAQAAAKELFQLGYSHYAFVPHTDDSLISWSTERSEVFRRCVCEAGCMFHSFDGTPGREQKRFSKWLRQLPNPCGIFAANDLTAQLIRTTCRKLDLRIPEDIAIIGVDNHLDICENDEPTLSSIQQNLEDCYYQAAKLLDEMIDHPKAVHTNRSFGILRVVRRASTRPLATVDVRIKRALEFIRLHAVERITPADVVAAMGCRRSYADQRFRECTGRSIVEEISVRRVELIKDALRLPDTRLEDLPASCGFASAVDMRRVFKKLTGMSPREWRKQQ